MKATSFTVPGLRKLLLEASASATSLEELVLFVCARVTSSASVAHEHHIALLKELELLLLAMSQIRQSQGRGRLASWDFIWKCGNKLPQKEDRGSAKGCQPLIHYDTWPLRMFRWVNKPWSSQRRMLSYLALRRSQRPVVPSTRWGQSEGDLAERREELYFLKLVLCGLVIPLRLDFPLKEIQTVGEIGLNSSKFFPLTATIQSTFRSLLCFIPKKWGLSSAFHRHNNKLLSWTVLQLLRYVKCLHEGDVFERTCD